MAQVNARPVSLRTDMGDDSEVNIADFGRYVAPFMGSSLESAVSAKTDIRAAPGHHVSAKPDIRAAPGDQVSAEPDIRAAPGDHVSAKPDIRARLAVTT